MAARAGSYHHGNLRRALLDEALVLIADHGVEQLSLRQVAARLGVSHAAPAHHFRDKTGLLTAIAAEGYGGLATALEESAARHQFLEAGLAYVAYALAHPAHFEVMFRPALHDLDDPALAQARARADAALHSAAAGMDIGADVDQVGLAGWCLMHGFATLWLAGNLAGQTHDPLALARLLGQVTFPRA